MASFDSIELSPYELKREENIRAREKFMEELRLSGKFKDDYASPPAKKPRKARPKKKASENSAMVKPVCRRSARLLLNKQRPVLKEKVPDNATPPRYRAPRKNFFGAVPGVPVGTHFATRMEASHAGVHRPTVAGIHGKETEGCYSIALSGGYEDDKDLGESFTYTGEGGRDLKGTKTKPKNLRTAAQSKDQVLTKGNLALANSVKFQRPVRVLRGFKLDSFYAPIEGYRYDGLYNVTSYKSTIGKSGFVVYKFKFKRCKDQASAPWVVVSSEEEGSAKGTEAVLGSAPATSTGAAAVTSTGAAAVTSTGAAAVTSTGAAAVTSTGAAAVTSTGAAAVTSTGAARATSAGAARATSAGAARATSAGAARATSAGAARATSARAARATSARAPKKFNKQPSHVDLH